MRILVLAACPFPWRRGTPIRIHRLSEALAERGHEVEVAAYFLGDEAIPVSFPVNRTRPLKFYNKTSPGPSLTKLMLLNPMLFQLARSLCSSKPFDLIYAHHIEALLVAKWLRMAGIETPIIYDAHTRIGEELSVYGPAALNSLKRVVGNWLDASLPASADHIVTVSDELRELFLNKAGKADHQVTTIVNGVERDFISKAIAAKAGPHSESNVQSSARTVAFAGNLAAYQGIDLLLQAFALVKAAEPEARLRLVTEGDFSTFEQLAVSLQIADAIDIVPSSLENLPAELAAADVLVNPRAECAGIPQKLLNYMASGTPTVSSSGSAKAITHDRNGLVVESGDVQAFAEAIVALLRDPTRARSLGLAAQTLVTRQYSWEAAAEAVENVWQSSLTGALPAS
ncbi:glycosyltransferase family 4 protein [Allohahella marinimesophila]|uniref:Glycosyltransferase family 4 protein n=1 Tax=Allohahella marinimesophila TaxID=1054972 RepID=A0ABP7PXI0_9GAMM